MNEKRIKSQDCRVRSLSSGISLQPCRINSLNSSGFLSCAPSDESSPTMVVEPPSLMNTGYRCVGSTPAAFYAAERLMGLPHFETEIIDGSPFFRAERDSRLSANSKKKTDAACSLDTLESLVNSASMPQNYTEGCKPVDSLVMNPILQSENGRGISKTSANVVQNKTRIRWSQDLHEKFVECLNRLGGADKATPKGILKLMNSEGLTIYHVKSHLQKYRLAKYTPESSVGKSEGRASASETEMGPKTGMEITEALRMQLEVQRRLHEQLEVQRNLQMRIEEQGRKLQKMFEEQLRTNGSTLSLKSNVHLPFGDSETLEDVQSLSAEEGSKNTHSPSQIS